MGLARVSVIIVAIVIAVAAVFALFRGIDQRSAPPIIIEDASVIFPVTVEVRGAVNAPGVYELPSGARMQDAINAAGGFTSSADLSTVNLARRLRDGETLLLADVPSASESGSAARDAPAAPDIDDAGRININAATMTELDSLPGIGEVTARRIIEFREEHGPYRSIDDLVLVDGISTRTVESLRDLIVVGP